MGIYEVSSEYPDAEIAAVLDENPNRDREAADKLGIDFHLSLVELLENLVEMMKERGLAMAGIRQANSSLFETA